MKPYEVPLVDLSWVNGRGVKDEALQRISTIGFGARWIDGAEVTIFEERWAEYCGARYCVGVANGTDALDLAVRGVFGPVVPAEPLVVPALTFVATAEAVVRAGETLILADVDPVTLLARGPVDVAVGLYGQPVPDQVVPAGVVDAAQMHGLGLTGATASWSFYPTKNLGAWGDAGAVTTDDEGLAQGIRELARHGGAGRTGVGFNSRLDTVQACVLIEKLNFLDDWLEARRQAVGSYQRRLRQYGLDVIGDPRTSACHLCVVRVPHRERVRTLMAQAGVETGIHYGRSLDQMVWLDPFRVGGGQAQCPQAQRAAAEVLSLPLWPGMRLETIDNVCEALVVSVERVAKENE